MFKYLFSMKLKFFLFFLLFYVAVFAEIKNAFSDELQNCLDHIRNADYSNGFYALKQTMQKQSEETNSRDNIVLLRSYYNICLSLLIDDFYNFSYEEDYIDSYKNTISFLEENLKMNEEFGNNLSLDYFCLGAVKGYRGLYESKFGSLFVTFLLGINGVSDLKKSLEYNSNNYDIYMGMGLYSYWKAVRASWLPFNKDEKMLGLSQLQKATEMAQYSRPEAVLSYSRALVNEQRYDEAEVYLKDFIKNYPENLYALFLTLKIHAYYENYKKVFSILKRIEKSYKKNEYYCSPITFLKFNYEYAFYCVKAKKYNLAREKINENLKKARKIKIKGREYYDYYYKASEKLNKQIDLEESSLEEKKMRKI